jgi:GDPmannose 4,6-dehydratase
MAKKAFITGIAGQDGSYLAEYLLSLGYEVHGIIRRNSVTEHQQSRLEKIAPHVHDVYGDVLDVGSLTKIIFQIKPDEIYNIAAQSHVRISFDVPQYTVMTNALGVLNVLEVIRQNSPQSKMYQASSSEMFGNSIDSDGYQRETTPMQPTSPYGCAKVFGYNIVHNYRKSYGLFASNGILFNHESPRRAANFVSTKIIKAAIRIKQGQQKTLELGELDSKRDWGHSRDYVRAMHAILQHSVADDFVIATGESHSVREFCQVAFNMLGLNYEEYVWINPKFFRPEELMVLRGDATKARKQLGWEPVVTFTKLIEEMMDEFLREMKVA